MAPAIEPTIRNDAVRNRSQSGKPMWLRTALKPEVIFGPAAFSTFSNPEVMAEPARLTRSAAAPTRVDSSASASAASSPSHS